MNTNSENVRGRYCSCWVKYPNQMHLKESGRWKCVDDYICVQDLQIRDAKCGVSVITAKTHCVRKGDSMDNLSMKNFENGFVKQLAYQNRTFLRGFYSFESGAEKFTVVKNGEVWDFKNLQDAINKFNEVSK